MLLYVYETTFQLLQGLETISYVNMNIINILHCIGISMLQMPTELTLDIFLYFSSIVYVWSRHLLDDKLIVFVINISVIKIKFRLSY
jgi:hypothetical protein